MFRDSREVRQLSDVLALCRQMGLTIINYNGFLKDGTGTLSKLFFQLKKWGKIQLFDEIGIWRPSTSNQPFFIIMIMIIKIMIMIVIMMITMMTVGKI